PAPAAPEAPVAPSPTVTARVAPEPSIAPAPAPSRAVEPPAAPTAPAAAAASAPAPSAPAAPAAHPPKHGGERQPVSRPTITLSNRTGHGPAVVERKAVTPAPKLVVPEPAKIQGPRVVREEKPDNLPAPRRRPTLGGPGEGPAFTQARPMAGRGVKVSDEEEKEAKKKAAAKGGRSLSNRRRGLDGRRGEAMEKLRDFSEQDLKERQVRLSNATSHKAEFDRHLKGAQQRGTHVQAKTAVERGEPVQIEEPITVKNLSAALGIKSND